MSTTTWSLLGDRSACVQAVNHLKLGVSPWRGLDFLSVGLDAQKRMINQALADARVGSTRTLVVELEYGFGKTHLLRLARELADLAGVVVSHITHDPLRNVAFNKPLNVYSEILTDLCREYPHAPYQRALEQLAPAYRQGRQAEFRFRIPERLTELGTTLAPPARKGLLVLIDELEGLSSSSMPNRRSREISYEVLSRLMSRQTGPAGCVVIMAVTPGTLDRFEADWHQYRGNILTSLRFPRQDIAFVPGTHLSIPDALVLHARIDAVHAIARMRRPMDPASLTTIGSNLANVCQQPDGSLHYRTFVQTCMTDFDIRFHAGGRTAGMPGASPPVLRTVPPNPPRIVLQPTSPSQDAPQTPRPPSHVPLSAPATPATNPGPGAHYPPVTPPANQQPAETARPIPGAMPLPSRPIPPTPPTTRPSIERMEMVPGASVMYQSPVGFSLGAVIVSVDWESRTARVRLTRIPMETTVDMDRLSANR